jgi:hypothetical protein
MKVKIKNYADWYGSYKIFKGIFFFLDEDHPLIDWLLDSRLGKMLDDFAMWRSSRYEAKRIRVHIDRWDTWNMDHTLAHIIHPMLIQLKKEKHGAPAVDYEDVPESLRPTDEEHEKYMYDGTTDKHFFDRWDWVMSEMIYAFEAKAFMDESYIRFDDMEDIRTEEDRIANGFRLFGKYYQGLWD